MSGEAMTAKTTGRRYRCPACHKSDGLWENVEVEGWRSIDEYLKPGYDRDVEWALAFSDGSGGCSCGWEGRIDDLEPIGIDDQPLPAMHPDQLEIEPCPSGAATP